MNKDFDEVISHFRDNCDNKMLNFNYIVSSFVQPTFSGTFTIVK